MKTSLFLLFLFFSTLGMGTNAQKSAEISADSGEEKDRDMRWEAFLEEMAWFLQSQKRAMISNIHGDELEEEIKQKQLEKYEAFKEALRLAHREFQEFREKVASCLACHSGEGRYAHYVYSLVEKELTEWYTAYMQKKLFPEDWKSRYEQDVKQHNQRSFLSSKE